MTPDSLLACFHETADAVRDAVATLEGAARRGRTERPGQYALDVVADEAALAVLRRAGVRVVSEESAETGDPAAITASSTRVTLEVRSARPSRRAPAPRIALVRWPVA